MEANEQNKEQNVEEMDVIKQLTEIMGQQGMGEQSQDFVEVLRYIAGMQLQLGAMVDELQGVREQLAKMQESQLKAVSSKLLEQVSHLQEKIGGLAERLSALKDHLIDTAAQAVTAFKEKRQGGNEQGSSERHFRCEIGAFRLPGADGGCTYKL